MSKRTRIARKRGPKKIIAIPAELLLPVPARARKTLENHFKKIDSDNYIAAFRTLLYLSLKYETIWRDDVQEGIWLDKPSLLNIYGVGKNALEVIDVIFDLSRFEIILDCNSPRISNSQIVTEIHATPKIKKAMHQILMDSDKPMVRAWDGVEFTEELHAENASRSSDLQNATDKQKQIVEIIERDDSWCDKIPSLLPEIRELAVQDMETGRIRPNGARRNLAILIRLRTQPIQRYIVPPDSPRIFGDSLNQLSRNLREEIERQLGLTVLDLNACHLTVLAYKFGWNHVIELLEHESGFWRALLEDLEVEYTDHQKGFYKEALQSLLFGRKVKYSVIELGKNVGTRKSKAFHGHQAIQQLSNGITQHLAKVVNDGETENARGNLIKIKNFKQAKTNLAKFTQSVEFHYMSEIVLALDKAGFKIRTFLHDGISFKMNNEREQAQQIVFNTIDEINEQERINMKFTIKH